MYNFYHLRWAIGAVLALATAAAVMAIPSAGAEKLVEHHQITLLNIQKLEPFGEGSMLNDFCNRCTMITDTQLNTYFASAISYPDVVSLPAGVELHIQPGKQGWLCKPGETERNSCIRIASFTTHGLSDLASLETRVAQ